MWDQLVLAHELVTEAVRILLPVAEFEAKERVLSFKALLLLGLRDSFGGDPSHFNVMQTEFPAPGDDRVPQPLRRGARRVPGGTGYLTRLGDPDQLKKILTRAEELITTCECQTRGEPGCHRCLYASIGRNEIPFVSRGVALEILEEILIGWQLKPAEHGTITGVNLSGVHQSELERMFKVLLQRWSDSHKVRVTSRPDPESASLTRFDVRFQDGPQWEIREQQNLVNHGTKPDFYATRVDGVSTAPVAIYLDGWEWHGKDVDQVDLDAQRRESVRSGGTSVWVLTYPDVKGALDAVSKESQMTAATPLSNAVRHHAGKGAKQLRGHEHPAFDALSLGAFDQLMTFLGNPDPTAWQELAQTIVLSAGSTGSTIPVDSLDGAVMVAALGGSPTPVGHETGIAAMTWTSQNGQVAVTALERGGDLIPMAVLAYDTSIESERNRWSDWLHLGNLIQYLGDRATITTTSTYDPEPSSWTETSKVEEVAATSELLEDVVDPVAKILAAAAVEAGWGDLTVGMEAGDDINTPIEVGWTAARVGILPSGVARPTTLRDWDLREPSEWTTEELLGALRGATI